MRNLREAALRDWGQEIGDPKVPDPAATWRAVVLLLGDLLTGRSVHTVRAVGYDFIVVSEAAVDGVPDG
jgi:hypothetical protein